MLELMLIIAFILVMMGFRALYKRKEREAPVAVSRHGLKRNPGTNVIYKGLKNEMSGHTGTNVRRLLRKSCTQTSLTASLSERIIEHIHAESLQGQRAKAIAEGLKGMLPDMTHAQLELIARTVIGKARTALERVRSEQIGLWWYVWETCQDERVRKSHRKMQGVIVPWNDPVSPEELIGEEETYGRYHAGEVPECRCDCLPLVSLSEVRWPHRVYYRGHIRRMTRVQFKRISGMSS